MSHQRYAFAHMTVGTCYYPEHWDEALWAQDLARMQECGVTVIRIGEFAWSLFEPQEGTFCFDLFDRFLALCEKAGMQVIFGTPTATPPAWLTHKYPEVLNCRIDGAPYRHGLRRHYNYNAPVYLEKCARITEKLAERYGKHPAVIGWQIDNEINCELDVFYSEADNAAFRVFLREKYGTLEALNHAWGAVFWSQNYTDWAQVHVPRLAANGSVNPHQHLDYLRFISHSARRFCALQSEILRRFIAPGVFITTNGLFGHLDNHAMTEESLDLMTYDSYPNFAFGLDRAGKIDRLADRWSGKKLTEVRSITEHFGIMEQQSGAGSWTCRMENPMPRPGQMLLWAMQSVAHGADFVSFFRWRTCTFGTEIYWHGILDHDNRDNRRMQELRTFAARMKQLEPVCGARVEAQIALLKDYDNVFDAEADNWHRLAAAQSEDALFEVSQLAHTPLDFAYIADDTPPEALARYKALVLPHAFIMTPARAALLCAYVQAGGMLIVGARSGCKDECGRCVMTPMPGLLAGLTGTDVKEYTLCSPAEDVPCALWDGERIPMPVMNEVIAPLEGTKVLARFASSYYAGEAAVTEKRVGAGRVLHVAGALSAQLARKLLDYLGLLEPLAELADAPEEIELVPRRGENGRFLFALNYQPRPVSMTLKAQALSLFTGERESGTITLPAYGVSVWRIED